MKSQFIPYEQALKLKELGFDEECFGLYNPIFHLDFYSKNYNINLITDTKQIVCSAPLWQQAFDWLCKKIDFYENNLSIDYSSNGWTLCIHEYDSNEVIDLFSNEKALDKLIEIVTK